MKNNFKHHYSSYIKELNDALSNINEEDIKNLLAALTSARDRRATVFIAGNGGNAATASHWATDLGKGLLQRKGMAINALSLTDNSAWTSAVGNDINFENIFSDQLEVHGKKGDLLICLSVSGKSPNILKAIRQASSMGIESLSIVGFDGGVAKEISTYYVHIPTPKGRYGVVEDAQMIISHLVCDYL